MEAVDSNQEFENSHKEKVRGFSRQSGCGIQLDARHDDALCAILRTWYVVVAFDLTHDMTWHRAWFC
jgi:hypothetical protein